MNWLCQNMARVPISPLLENSLLYSKVSMSRIKILSKNSAGFTLVELLIVIVIIAILAAITIVSYNGVQARAYDAQRASDISTLAKALEVYYADNGSYPSCAGGGGTAINSSWCTTADSSWDFLAKQLVPKYISAMPKDPISQPFGANTAPWGQKNGYDYSYVGTSGYCGISPSSQPPQMYIIVYKLAGTSNYTQTSNGICDTNPLSYPASWYRAVRGGS